MRRRIAVPLVTAAALVFPPPAVAALRYASASGTPTNDCQTVMTACDPVTAVNGTTGNMPNDGDEVVIEPGSYTLTTTLNPGANNMNNP